MSGNFFPPEYKSSYYREGDVLAYPCNGKFAVARILKIDAVNLAKGQTLEVAEDKVNVTKLTVTEDDSLLILGVSLSEPVFEKFEDTWTAFEKRALKITKEHTPLRTIALDSKAVLLGNYRVTEAELTGYQQWKTAFKKGEAIIF